MTAAVSVDLGKAGMIGLVEKRGGEPGRIQRGVADGLSVSPLTETVGNPQLFFLLTGYGGGCSRISMKRSAEGETEHLKCWWTAGGLCPFLFIYVYFNGEEGSQMLIYLRGLP